jgi:predicted nucleotidyltransferase
MLNTFINDFKQSNYYKQIYTENESNTVLGIYLVGSTCMGLDDDNSDYDITVLTLKGDYIDKSEEFHLRYKGKKVH